ncbi:MAG TPA: hypothetical protein VH917_03620, partial [Ignavibacteriaceae bacterium]
MKLKNLLSLILVPILISLNQSSAKSWPADSTEADPIPDSTPLTVGFNFHYGSIIPHANEVVNVRGSKPKGYELNFSWLLNTSEVWDDCHCYPRLGLLLTFYDYDFPEVLGYGYGTAMDFTYFFGLLNDFNFLLKGKAGIIYLTKPYDSQTHPENMSYSTYFNYLLSIGAGIKINLNQHLELQLIGS